MFSLVIPLFAGVTGIFGAVPAADVCAILVTAAVMAKLWKELNVPNGNAEATGEAVLRQSKPGVIVTIARSDAAWGAYYKSVSGQNWGDPHQYELSLDSSIGVEKTASLIFEYLK